MVSRFIQDEHLRQAFSFHSLLVGGNPFATSSIYALIHALERQWGVWFPRGGTGALVRGLVRLFEDLGGTHRAERAGGARSRPRATRATGVRLEDGALFAADAVASQRRRGAHLRQACWATIRAARRRASALAQEALLECRCSCIYFGLDSTITSSCATTRCCFGPRYRELIAEIFNGDDAGRRLLALPARALRHRPVAGAARLRQPLRAGAGAAPGQRADRLGGRRAALPRPHLRLPGGALHAGPAQPTWSPAASSRRSISATSSTRTSARRSRSSRS